MDTKEHIYIKLKRPEGYEDVHPYLVIEDSGVKAEFEPEAVDIAALIAERDDLALERGALLQRVVELEGASAWQPIETAPREGSFLVYTPDERLKVQGAHRNANGVFVIGNSFAFDITRPTHWMLLPPAPKGHA